MAETNTNVTIFLNGRKIIVPSYTVKNKIEEAKRIAGLGKRQKAIDELLPLISGMDQDTQDFIVSYIHNYDAATDYYETAKEDIGFIKRLLLAAAGIIVVLFLISTIVTIMNYSTYTSAMDSIDYDYDYDYDGGGLHFGNDW